MIQDIAPYIFDNQYKNITPQGKDYLLAYDGRKVLVKESEEGISFPSFSELKGDYNCTYLFSVGDRRFFLGSKWMEGELVGYEWRDIQIYRNATPKHFGFAVITGWQLYRWYDTRKYCGRCATRMEKDEKERMMKCPKCGQMEFPKICPAVIIGVTHGNKILMSKYAGREYTRYALLAGFMEIGETPEETVKREVMEEVGIKVKNIRYYKSQPWSMSDTLLLGFFCELDGDDETVVLDKEELALAEWFEREEMPVEPEDVSLTNAMMMAFKNNEVGVR